MKVSAIQNNENSRFNAFIRYSNSFMSMVGTNNKSEEKVSVNNSVFNQKQDKTMGLETLTIFPKQVINGKTVITA